jgi:hypothetical protein
MVSPGSYVLSVFLLAVLVLSLGFSAIRLRQRLMPEWDGAPAHLVEAILGVALLIWLAELLGVVNLFYAGTLVASALILAAAIAVGPRVLSRRRGAGQGLGFSPQSGTAVRDRARGEKQDAPPARHPSSTPPAGEAMTAVAIAVVAVVFAHWGLTAKDALDRGIFNFDSLWYHLPFAVEMAHSHSVTGLHYTETVFTNWFYPQNSELLHATGILLTGRDTMSLFLNFGWLAIAFLAAWCIGRPYGRGPLTVVAAAVVLECHTLVVREPGAAKNDLMAASLLLAAIAILVNADWGASVRRGWGWPGRVLGFSPRASSLSPSGPGENQDAAPARATPTPVPQATATGRASWWAPLAVAGLATGLSVGTKSTAVAMAAALTVAAIALAPARRRWAAAGWWFAAVLTGCGYWYLRNLIVTGNPLPQLEHLGPISLPHPERLQEGRPDFSIAHYATDTGVWHEYFAPGLHQAFGVLWPLVIFGAIAGALSALLWGRTQVLRWIGGVALFGMLVYIFTPLSAAGAEGAPTGFAINIRYAIPALLAGLTLLPLAFRGSALSAPSAGGMGKGVARSGAASCFSPGPIGERDDAQGEKPSTRPGPLPRDRTRGWGIWEWAVLGALVLVLIVSDRSDAVLRDPNRLFGLLIALLAVGVPAALLFARRRRASRGALEPVSKPPAHAWRRRTRRGAASSETGNATGIGRPPASLPRSVRRTPVAHAEFRDRFLVAGFAALALVVVAIGYPVQRHYLRDRFLNADAETSIPGMHLDSVYRWARNVSDVRIGLAGTTAGFLEYGFYGTDLSNRVRYLGVKGSHGAFNAIPTCGEFRAAVNAADLDYLVTAPFLNFIEPGEPIPSPETRWLRGEPAVAPIETSGPVTIWRVRGRLDPSACGPSNAPLHEIPQQPVN